MQKPPKGAVPTEFLHSTSASAVSQMALEPKLLPKKHGSTFKAQRLDVPGMSFFEDADREHAEPFFGGQATPKGESSQTLRLFKGAGTTLPVPVPIPESLEYPGRNESAEKAKEKREQIQQLTQSAGAVSSSTPLKLPGNTGQRPELRLTQQTMEDPSSELFVVPDAPIGADETDAGHQREIAQANPQMKKVFEELRKQKAPSYDPPN